MIGRYLVVLTSLVLASCASQEDVTGIHPHRDRLLGSSKTTRKLYLHDKGREGYQALTSETVGYQFMEDGSKVATRYPADMILPVGTTVTVDRIGFGSNTTLGPHTTLYGRAFPKGRKEPVRIFALHESLGVELADWQKKNLRLKPTTAEYLRLSKDTSLPW